MADDTKAVSSVILDIIGKFVFVLSKTKDAVIQDLINELGKDVVCPGNDLDKVKFVVELLKRLGYDLESTSIKNMTTPFITVFDSAAGLSEAIKPLLDSIPALAELPSQLTGGGEGADAGAVDPAALVKQAQTLYDSVKNLIDGIKAIEQIKWESDIANFMKESGFNEDFVKRFFDHCVAVFLQQAMDIFTPMAEDQIRAILAKLNDSALKSDLEKYLPYLTEDPRKVIDTILEKLTGQMAGPAKKEIEQLLQLKKTGVYFECVYAVLEFLKIINDESVEVLKAAGSGSNPSQLVTASIHVIHWDRVEKLATDPLGYCKQHFPVNNYADAEALLNRLIKLVRVFDPDLLDFHSVESMAQYVFSLLLKYIKEAASKVTDNTPYLNMLRNLLTALKRMMDELKGKLVSQINTTYSETKALLNEMARDVNNQLGTTGSAAYKQLTTGIQLPALNDNVMRTILEKSLLPLLVEKAQYLDKFQSVSREEWGTFLTTTVKSFQAITDRIVADITTLISQGTDVETFVNKLRPDLEKEFTRQTKNIPTTSEAFTAWLRQPTNPFDFNLQAYLNILQDHIRQISIPSPDKYYAELKTCANNAYTTFINKAEGQHSQLKKAGITQAEWKQLADRFFAAAWEEIRRQLIEPMLYPFLQLMELKIRGIACDLINAIKNTDSSVYCVPGAIQGDTLTIPAVYTTFAKDLLGIVLKVANGAYKDMAGYVQLGTDLFAAIPSDIKTGLGIGGISIDLPPYQFSAADKFISVTLYDGKKIAGAEANIKFDLAAFIDKREGVDGLHLIPVFAGDLTHAFSLGVAHTLTMKLSALLNDSSNGFSPEKLKTGTMGLFISTNGVELLTDTGVSTGAVDLVFQRKVGYKVLDVIKSPYFDFTIADYPQTISTGYKNEKFVFTYKGEVKDAKIALKVGQINDFLATIIKDDIEFMLNLALIYDLEKGFSFEGKPSMKFELDIDQAIGALKISTLTFELGNLSGEPVGKGDQSFTVKVTTSFSVNFSSVVFALKGLGASLDINYLKKDGSIGDFAISPNFEFPTGLALSIDASAVKGTGILTYDKAKEEFMGALELMIVDTIKVGAIAILSMRMPDGSKGFSFMTLVSVFFTPGIQVGMGFSLTGLGGTIGIHRRINNDMLMTSVREGTITSVFFVEDLAKNLDKMMVQIPQFFPVQKDQFFVGILARITYAEIIHICIGLLVQAPKPTQILIVGGIFINLPAKENALLKLNVYFCGGIDFDQGIWFDASIVNSSIAGFDIYGDMALRLFWGGPKKGFLYSAGGFHPAYVPDAGFNLGKMKRLGMGINYGIVKIALESYFALTSNTVQFGADLSLTVKWGKFGIYGYFGFDCLFQFRPFYFMFDVRAGVAVKIGSTKICCIKLAMNLQGPGPWRAKGTASFSILFFSIDVDFELEWGKKQQLEPKRYVDIYPKLAAEYRKVENWRIIPSRQSDDLVKIYRLNDANDTFKELVMQPYDGIQFEQAVVPLNKRINRFGEEKPLDFFKIELDKIRIGDTEFTDGTYTPVQTDFAPTLFIEMKDNEKLKAPSYEKMQNGVQLSTGMSNCKVSATTSRTVDYDTMQDTITFSGNYFKVQHEVDENKTEEHLYIAAVTKAPVPRVSITKGVVTKVTIIKEPIIKAPVIEVPAVRRPFKFEPQIARRSDASFKRHVKKLQQPRAAEVSEKITALHDLISQENGFKIDSKVNVSKLAKRALLEARGSYTSRMEMMRKLEADYPELKNKLFVSYTKRTALVTKK